MPEDIKNSTYNGYTEARKKANEKYNAKFHEVKVRMLPERHEMVKKQPVLIISTDKFIRGMEYRELKERVLAETVTAGIGSELKDIVFTTDELLGSDDFKLNRRKIRAKYEAGGFTGIKNDGETGDGMMVTDDAMALKVREMVASAIDRETGEVGYESDFFIDLGGSSLDYFSMLCEIEEEFGISIPDETGTGLRSVRKICEYIKDRK